MLIRIEIWLKSLVFVMGSQERLKVVAVWIPKKLTFTKLKVTRSTLVPYRGRLVLSKY